MSCLAPPDQLIKICSITCHIVSERQVWGALKMTQLKIAGHGCVAIIQGNERVCGRGHRGPLGFQIGIMAASRHAATFPTLDSEESQVLSSTPCHLPPLINNLKVSQILQPFPGPVHRCSSYIQAERRHQQLLCLTNTAYDLHQAKESVSCASSRSSFPVCEEILSRVESACDQTMPSQPLSL